MEHAATCGRPFTKLIPTRTEDHALAQSTRNAGQSRRLLTLAEIYDGNYRIPLFREAPDGAAAWLNLSLAAALIGIAARTLRLAAERGVIEAKHPLEDGP